MENTWFLKKLNLELTYDPKILLLGIYPKELREDSKRNLYRHVQSNIIYNSQKVDATKYPLTHKEKHDVVNDKILFSLKKDSLTYATT